MRKKTIIFIFFFLLLVLIPPYLVISTKQYRSELREQYKHKAELYLDKKYQEEMVVHDDVQLYDTGSVTAHLKSNPDIAFCVFEGGNGLNDEYLQEHLRYETQQKFFSVLQQYFSNDFSLKVGGIVWENPDPSGELETHYYLYKLYWDLGRPPTWTEVGSNVRLDFVKIFINGVLESNEQREELRQKLADTECHAERVELTDRNEMTEDFTFPY